MTRIVPMTLNLVDGFYEDLINKLRKTLADHDDRQDVSNNPVLPKQKYGKQPARWIYINLVGNNDDKATLAIRDDNVYLIGFKNKRGDWYEFGYSGRKTRQFKSKPMVNQESTFLECDVDYRSIVGGAMNLVKLKLGCKFAEDAVCRLSGYTQAPDGEADDKIKADLACLIVMICEAARMQPHYNTVKDGWWNRLHGRNIDEHQVRYLLNWGDTSEALLRWDSDPQPNNYAFPKHLKKIGIKNSWHALRVVYMLLNRRIDKPPRWNRQQLLLTAGDNGRSDSEQQPPFKRSRTEQQPDQGHSRLQQQQQPNQGRGRSHSQQQETAVPPGAPANYEGHGRPLVEVFAVRASYHFVGTIAVFDGMRGQIIYENDVPIHDPVPSGDNALLLTGPYRAISAYGSFTIEVDPQIQGKSNDAAELNWDCYDEDKEYDVPVTDTITMKSGRTVKVTYAVLSDAVEANVEVHLLLPGAPAQTHVYGQITARSQALDRSDQAWSVLFDSGLKGEVVIDCSSSMARLPLARSVVAMPLGSPLVIKATLYDAPPSQFQEGAGHFFQCQDLKLTLSDHTRKLPTENGGQVEVKITSPDLYPADGPSDDTMTTPPPRCSQYTCPNF